MKGKERRNERKREITSPGSRTDPADGTSQALGHVHAQAPREFLFIEKFFHPGDKFLTFSAMSYHVQSILLDLSRNG